MLKPQCFNSINIIIAEPIKCEIKRSFWARVFSLTPHKAYKIEFKDILEDGHVHQSSKGLHMNAKTFNQFKRHTNVQKN